MKILVADVMSVRLICARPDTPINEVARTLVRDRIGGMPVVDAEGRVKGIVSESDLQQPPLGAVGRTLDRVLLYRLAEATAKRFVWFVSRGRQGLVPH